MRKILILTVALAFVLFAALPGVDAQGKKKKKDGDDGSWTKEFFVEKGELASVGRNTFFILEPGYQIVLEGGGEKMVKTVLKETKMVDGIECAILEERETKDGKIVEISRNYYAISKKTSSVYYFGEDVDIYKGDKVASHDGSWLSGVKGAKFGLMMPGTQVVKGRYYQEIAPGAAMDRAEIVSVSETVTTPGGKFENCLKVEESTPLEPTNIGYKYYAPGVGIVKDGKLLLTKYGKAEK